MWTNRASGNISNSVFMRQVCGGDFNTIRFGCRSVRHFKNHISPRFQRSRRLGESPARSKYSSHCGGRLGKAIVRYGEGTPMLHRANSSSCGRSQPAAMLSIGRFAGSNSRNNGRNNQPDTKKWFGAKQANVSG